MPQTLSIEFADLATSASNATVLLLSGDKKLKGAAKRLDKSTDGAVARAIEAADFKAKARTCIEVLGANGGPDRILIVGTGDVDNVQGKDWLMLGGYIAGQLASRKVRAANLLLDLAGLEGKALAAVGANIALGAQLRGYAFDHYKSEAKNDEARQSVLETLTVQSDDEAALAKAYEAHRAVAEGVALARDLVNEPANRLGPVEFAERCTDLKSLGVDVQILDENELRDLGFEALLAVAQGSERPARVAIMVWHGAKSKRNKPVCFVGKGVVFDTGGISIKPAGGMEDMKGDMGGAACVVGLMHALAARKANVNAVGLVGLVENMPSGTAMRPGDVIGSRAKKTIEVLNTDAEGRLVLADLLAYAEETYKPKFMVDLATLTGAIIVALGKENAGMFTNDDKLADQLRVCGEETGEAVWRMPLGKGYDKLIDSKTADMKNIGGRNGGAITAAQFLQRFVTDTPWAHLDVAGVAFDSPKSEINPSWGSGWGVRLLDHLVAKHYES